MLKRAILAVWVVAGLAAVARAQATVLLEAESFTEPGGWVIDTQFVHIMGSPYLMAHGMGTPVKNASTTVEFKETGTYKVFVRTKDWVARWNAPGQPGKFHVLVDGKALEPTFGTVGAEWHWQSGGSVEITKTTVQVALKDLTGFNGRCDAIVFTKGDAPPEDVKQLTAWRKKTLGLPEQPKDAGTFDLVVVGGGYGGLGTAISASRMGVKVALIQDRPVLGGNGSSEIRVWSMGGTTLGKYPRLGEIVEEFADSARSSPGSYEEFGDEKKEKIVRAEKNITLFLNTQAYAVDMKDGKIAAVYTRNMRTSEELKFNGKLFADCTGHGHIGAMAGAEFKMADGSGPDQLHMGMSNMWRWDEAPQETTFPETPWALPLTMKDFPYPNRGKAEWFWEGGFFRHPINDLEYIRDWNFRAIFGAFSAMKNGDGKDKHARAKLEWIAYVGGNRESRLLTGDVVLTREDVINKVDYPDGCVPTTWSIDLHVPKEQFASKFPQDPFISKAIFDSRVDKKVGYPVPYRCFYSKNIPNMFMAGRNVSVDRGALGTVRVMRTGGMMGEVVGKAASICVKHGATPREVYEKHLDELKTLMQLPGRARRATVKDEIDPDAPLPSSESEKRAYPHRERPSATAAAGGPSVDVTKIAGVVVDDAQAKLTGEWKPSTNMPGFVGKGYHFSDNVDGEKSARFEFKVPSAGKYDVRIAYRSSESRSTEVPVTVTSAGGDKALKVNMQEAPKLEHGFHSLGVFEFTDGGAVTISTAGTKGHVIIDAVQVVPVK